MEAAAQNPSTRDAAPPPTERHYWNRRYAAKEFIWTANANQFLAAEVENLLPGTAMDLAAGEGRNAVWLAERGWSVRAVDFSAVAIHKGKRLAMERKVAERIDFQIADLRDYEFHQGAFDLVTIIYLQIPQGELAAIIAHAARAVARGGTFLLVGHDSSNLERGYGGPQDPDLLYTAEHVLAALGGRLGIEKAGTIERRVETEHGMKVAIDCLVRGKRYD
jgi:SAM-dependent methyltransferase